MIVHASSATMDVFEKATRHFTGSSHGAAAFVESPETIALIATDGPEVQGWCWGHLLPRPDGTTMLYLHNLEVDESHRRQGVARELLNTFIDAGVNHGATRMFLTTGKENTPARHLYETAGALLAAQGPTVNYWFHLPPSHPHPHPR